MLPMETMNAARLHEIGGPEAMRCERVEVPVPAHGERLVRIRAAALNHRDLFITQGLYPNITLPRILGSDGCGESEGRAVVIDPTVGWGESERVWGADATILGMPREGTFAQAVCVPERNIHSKPAHLSDEQAAALPLAGVTAFRATFTRGELRAGETLLVTGIGGGVATFVLLFAKAAGARVIVTSTSDAKLERARKLGADVAINVRSDSDWHKAVRKAGPIDLAVDSVGGETFARVLTLVRPGGRVVTFGGTSGDAKVKMFPIFWNQIDVRGSSMGSPRDFAQMLALVERHRIVPVIDHVFELSEIAAAMQRLNQAEQFGKIVLRV